MPGDVQDQGVLLQNHSGDQLTFYLKANPSQLGDSDADESSQALLQQLKLEVRYHEVASDGEIVRPGELIYQGPASGQWKTVSLRDYISLGTLDARKRAALQIGISVPTSLGNEYQNAMAAMDWSFYCVVNETSDSGSGGNGGSSSGHSSGTVEILEGGLPASLPDSGVNDWYVRCLWALLIGFGLTGVGLIIISHRGTAKEKSSRK